MSNLNKAMKILIEGGIVIFPTDTAFGIGCRIDDKQVIKRLFKIRRRPKDQAAPVLVNSIEMSQNYLLSPLLNNVRHLMEKYWPGALTVVYPCKEEIVPSLVRGNGKNLGVRMPNHEIALKLISGVGVPILGPSANFHGLPTPYTFEQLDPELIKLVDYVVSGKCKTGNVSTVVDCSVTPWKTIRQGTIIITKSDIF